MTGPLSGVRVIELPAIGPVPFLGMLLADLGAEVVRIDRLAEQSPEIGALLGGPLGRGRRSLGLDLRRGGAAEVVLRLAERSDAIIEGFRPGVAERLGIGPAVLLERNPALVYGRLTGWGQDGPLSATAGHDINYLAITGLLNGIGEAGHPPIPPINYVADLGGGAMFLATGLLAALLHARETGSGQVVDVSMSDGASYLGSMTRALLADGVWADERAANLIDGGAPNYRCYECADGGYVAVGALEPQFWSNLVRALGADPTAIPSPYDRRQWSACAEWLGEIFRTKSRDEWSRLFAPIDACVSPVLTLEEAPNHPYNSARSSFVRVGSQIVPAPAPRFSATLPVVGQLTPVDRNGAELLDELEFTESDLENLRLNGAIGARES